MTQFKLAFCAASFLGAPFAFGPAIASESDVLMTVIAPAGQHQYSLEDLQALPQVSFTTTTIWTKGEQEFTGVPLSALLEDAGLTTGSAMATAINDYAVEIPLDEIDENFPVVAYHLNGKPMSIRDKGPLWIVYPYDQSLDFQTEVNYSRSIWQLDRIVQGE